MPSGDAQTEQASAVHHPPLPASAGSARGEGYKNVEPSEAHKLITEGKGTYLDVRTPEEYSEGHAPGSINVPIMIKGEGGALESNPKFLSEVKERLADSEAPVATSCMHGRRGELAAQTLADAGFPNLVNIKGGFSAWIESHLPSTK